MEKVTKNGNQKNEIIVDDFAMMGAGENKQMWLIQGGTKGKKQ